MSEKHECSFEEFDVRVQVEADGACWVSFRAGGYTMLTLSLDDFREVLNFAAIHGPLRMTRPYVVEYAETIEGAAESSSRGQAGKT
jgi:hypothetical protein